MLQKPVDRTPEHLEKVPEMRVSTLTPSSVKLVQRCDAWEELAPPNSATVEQMQVLESLLWCVCFLVLFRCGIMGPVGV